MSMEYWWNDTDRRNWWEKCVPLPLCFIFICVFVCVFILYACVLYLNHIYTLSSPPLLNSFSILICLSSHHYFLLAVFISLIFSQLSEILLKTCSYRTRVCSVLLCCIDFPQVTVHFEQKHMYTYLTWIILDLYILPKNVKGRHI